MELEVKQKKKWHSRRGSTSTLTGFLSFLFSLIALAGLNVSLLMESEQFPDLFLAKLPIIGFILGLMGLFTQKRSRLYAIWGISICLFLFIFTFLMFALAWSINPIP